MWAQVIIRFRKALNSRTFIAGLPAQTEKAIVLKDTSFEKTPDIVSNIVYTHEGPSEKLILFDNGISSLIAHLLPKSFAPDLGRIKDRVDSLVSKFFDAARNSGNQIQYLEVGIAFEEEVILKGTYRGKWSHVWERISDNFFWNAIIGALSFGAALVVHAKAPEVFIPAIAAVLGLPIWAVILALIEKERIHYEER